MKKIVVVLVALVFALTTTVEAKKLPAVAAKLPVQLKGVITENLSYPSGALNQYLEGDVWMKICVTDESKIKVIDLSSTNPELGVYVKKELSSLYVDNPGCKAGQVYYLKVKFDLTNKD
ncbi:MAG: hypothetical protein PF517_14305 [Salinivirgaceae bacterium]|jgi:hypothetical protein|nr:hypothetical protein [Salinivirgaceae bacterium]